MKKGNCNDANNIGLAIFIVLAGVFSIWVIAFLLITFCAGAAGYARTGQIGDAFGSLNTLFSGLSFGAVAITLFLQQRDLSLQAKQIEQAIEHFRREHYLSTEPVFRFHVEKGKASAETSPGGDLVVGMSPATPVIVNEGKPITNVTIHYQSKQGSKHFTEEIGSMQHGSEYRPDVRILIDSGLNYTSSQFRIEYSTRDYGRRFQEFKATDGGKEWTFHKMEEIETPELPDLQWERVSQGPNKK